MTIEKTLNDRESTYGSFKTQAEIAQTLKAIVRHTDNWDSLDCYMQESIEMILHKIARILNGDPKYIDSWHDVAGYATLVEYQLIEESENV